MTDSKYPSIAKLVFEEHLANGPFATQSIAMRDLIEILRPFDPICMQRNDRCGAFIFEDKSFLHILFTPPSLKDALVYVWHIEPFKSVAEFRKQLDNLNQLNNLVADATVVRH